MLGGVRRPLVVSVEREEGRIEPANGGVVLKEGLEWAEQLDLFDAGAIVPIAYKGPQVRSFGERRVGRDEGHLFLRPEKEIEKLALNHVDITDVPGEGFCEWPNVPLFVFAVAERVSVEGGPAVDVFFITSALDEQRPEIACLVVARVPLIRVAKEGPTPGQALDIAAVLVSVKRDKALFETWNGLVEFVAANVHERPKLVRVIILVLDPEMAKERPDRKSAGIGSSLSPQDGVRKSVTLGAIIFSVHEERPKSPRNGVVAKKVLNVANKGENAAIGSMWRAGIAVIVDRENGKIADGDAIFVACAAVVDEGKDRPAHVVWLFIIGKQRVQEVQLALRLLPVPLGQSKWPEGGPVGIAFLVLSEGRHELDIVLVFAQHQWPHIFFRNKTRSAQQTP